MMKEIIRPSVDVVDIHDVELERTDKSGAIMLDLSKCTPEDIPSKALGNDNGYFVHLRQPRSTIPVYYKLGWRHAGFPSDAR